MSIFGKPIFDLADGCSDRLQSISKSVETRVSSDIFESHGPLVSAPEWMDVRIAKAHRIRLELRLPAVTKRVESAK